MGSIALQIAGVMASCGLIRQIRSAITALRPLPPMARCCASLAASVVQDGPYAGPDLPIGQVASRFALSTVPRQLRPRILKLRWSGAGDSISI